MNERFLAAKAEWVAKMERGDMSNAARIAGVTWQTFQEWVKTDRRYTEKARRNLKALKQAVKERERNMEEVMAA